MTTPYFPSFFSSLDPSDELTPIDGSAGVGAVTEFLAWTYVMHWEKTKSAVNSRIHLLEQRL